MKIKYFKSDDKTVNNKYLTLLYDQYKQKFIAFALKYFSIDKNTLEDIYQESFIVLYQQIQNGTFPEHSVSIQTYLFGIGKNKILNYLRDNRYETIEISENILFANDWYDSDDWIRKQEITYQLVDNMEEPCNRILQLFYYDRKTMSEITQVFNYKNEQVAKNRKYLCVNKLKDNLKHKLKEEGLI